MNTKIQVDNGWHKSWLNGTNVLMLWDDERLEAT
jgi:hypothetical protein